LADEAQGRRAWVYPKMVFGGEKGAGKTPTGKKTCHNQGTTPATGYWTSQKEGNCGKDTRGSTQRGGSRGGGKRGGKLATNRNEASRGVQDARHAMQGEGSEGQGKKFRVKETKKEVRGGGEYH